MTRRPGRSPTSLIPIDLLDPVDWNPNEESDAAFAALVESIRSEGFTMPLRVAPTPDGRYQIIAGEHRWRAAKVLEMPVSEQVEMDHTYIGGRRRGQGRGYVENKTPVLGVVQRKGRVRATPVENVRRRSVMPIVREYVLSRAVIYTDEGRESAGLRKRGYAHRRIHHSSQVYVRGDVHTNTIDGFWSLVKRGISGVYHAVSAKHLQSYLNEYSFRYNHRADEQPMFKTMLAQVEKA